MIDAWLQSCRIPFRISTIVVHSQCSEACSAIETQILKEHYAVCSTYAYPGYGETTNSSVSRSVVGTLQHVFLRASSIKFHRQHTGSSGSYLAMRKYISPRASAKERCCRSVSTAAWYSLSNRSAFILSRADRRGHPSSSAHYHISIRPVSGLAIKALLFLLFLRSEAPHRTYLTAIHTLTFRLSSSWSATPYLAISPYPVKRSNLRVSMLSPWVPHVTARWSPQPAGRSGSLLPPWLSRLLSFKGRCWSVGVLPG